MLPNRRSALAAAWLKLGFGLAFAALVGCTSRARHLGPDTGTLTTTDTGTVSTSGVGGNSTTGSTASVASVSVATSTTGATGERVCETAAVDCDSATPIECSEAGQWFATRAACAIACSNGACTECVEAERQCKDGAAQVCVGGMWTIDQVCPATCEAGACVEACTANRLQCSGDKWLQRCNGVEYVDEQECEFVCQGDACVGECVPDAKRCKPDAANEAQSCNATGAWDASIACPADSFCVEGDCKPCAPDTRRCTETGPQLCSVDGEWAPQGSCEAPTPYCLLGNCVLCSPGSRTCNGAQVEECSTDGSSWSVIETCSGETPACIESIKGCGRCIEGEIQCSNDILQTCNSQGGWETTQVCSEATPECVGEACVACDPAASERQCQDANSTQDCGPSGEWNTAVDCSGDKPICRADLNSTCGCEEGERRCLSNRPQECVGGAWVAEATCTGTLDYCLATTGRCVACEPGEEECLNGVARVCNDDGGWTSLNSCSGTLVNCGGCDLGEDCTAPTDCNSGSCVNYQCVECSPGARRCQDADTTDTCSGTGSWGTIMDCTGNLPLCRSDLGPMASCGCNEGDRRCVGNAPEECVLGQWSSEGNCMGTLDYCLPASATCVVCQPGEEECLNGVARSCSTSGTWTSLNSCAGTMVNCGGCDLAEKCGENADCDSGACVNGSCTPCLPAQSQACGSCSGGTQKCSTSGSWGACTFKSCANTAQCNGESCCTATLVSGGSFYRGEDTQAAATVSNFCMDKYEISVGRFREFVNAYDSWTPTTGAGEHVAGAGTGWLSGWAKGDELPSTASQFNSLLACSTNFATWTTSAGTQENLPQNCLTWYQAFAFCIWDGGRLATEAEWEYAAAGGGSELAYPWGNDLPTASLAVFTPAQIKSSPVGSKQPAGNGFWGQSDLAGSLQEWNFDWYAAYPAQCNNCAVATGATGRVIRGGSWGSQAAELAAASRSLIAPTDSGSSDIGARCVRAPR